MKIQNLCLQFMACSLVCFTSVVQAGFDEGLISISFGGRETTHVGQAVVGSSDDKWNAPDEKDGKSFSLTDVTAAQTAVRVTFDAERTYDAGENSPFTGGSHENLLRQYLVTFKPCDVVLEGLTPDARYSLYLYSASDPGGNRRVSQFTVGEHTRSATFSADEKEFVCGINYTHFIVNADKAGTLKIRYAGFEGGEGNLNGLQILPAKSEEVTIADGPGANNTDRSAAPIKKAPAVAGTSKPNIAASKPKSDNTSTNSTAEAKIFRTVAIGEWPRWRGSNHDAISPDKGLLKTWSKDGPPLAWKTSGLGSGFASVAISGGRIFTMGKRKDGEELIALAGDNGSELWSLKIGSEHHDEPSSTPTVDGDRVYAISTHGDLVCATVDGKEVWRKSFLKDFGGSVPTWKYCESPLIDGDKLICSPGSIDATMVALNKLTGEVIWKAAVPNGGGNGAGYSSIVISEAAGVRQYVQLYGAGTGCVGIAVADGRFLWKYDRVGNGTAAIPTPIVDGDLVFCSSGYGTGAALLQLKAEGSGVKATELYFLKGNDFQNHHGGMIHAGQYIFAGNGHNQGFPTCLDMKTGKIIWGGKQRGEGTGSAAVVFADDKCYFRYQDGTMALVDASSTDYHVDGSFKIPEVRRESWSHPVVVGKKLYLREQENLFVYDVAAK